MSQIFLWKDDVPVDVQCEEHIISDGISQLCFIDPYVLVISKRFKDIHCGKIEKVGEKLNLQLQNTTIHAVCIASTASKELLYVNEDGQVFSTRPGNLEDSEEITITEDAKCCIHGHNTPKQQVHIKFIATSEQGTLFLSRNGVLWACGNYPQLDIKPIDGIKRVNYFMGRTVAAIACGSNFSVALVHKKDATFINKESSSNEIGDAGDVFVYGCPKCFSESTVSIPSHNSSSDICPLGLSLRKYSIDHSTSSTTSKENNEKKSIDGTTSPSTEDEVIHRSQTSAIFNDNKSAEVTDNANKEPGLVNGDKEERTENPECEGEKKNSSLLNTEVARQFLTRQLSWVSSYGNAGEEFLAEYTEGTSRLVRQNVSNVANLVYEGVRTVGDKVATLSRHVSGGSDSCTGNEDSFEDLILEDFKPSSTACLRCEDFFASSSAGTSDHEGDCDLEGMDVGNACESGTNILGAELYSWGSVNHGQLGIGDCLKRDRPIIIGRLSGTGINKVCCGTNHAVALTLDGRMFAWGANGSGQIDWKVCPNLSTPSQVLCGSVSSGSDRIWDIACGSRHSLMLTHGGDVFFLGKHRDASNSGGPVKLSVLQPVSLEEGVVAQKQLFAHGHLSWCAVHPSPVSPAVQDLALEQSFLEECLLVQLSLIKPFLKKMSSGAHVDEYQMYSRLCNSYSDVLSFTAYNAFSLLKFAENGVDASTVAMVQSVDDHVRVYRNLLESTCNVLAVNGFSLMANMVEPPPKICELFADRLPPLGPAKKGSRRNPNEATFACALLHPLSRLNVFKCIMQSLIRCNNSVGPPEPLKLIILKKLQMALSKWESLCDESDQKRREAESTRRFWESAGRLLETVRTPSRRLVRESRTHPIQVRNSGRFISPWLVLLNDVLVHVAGSSVTVHPLHTVWVEPLSDEDNGQSGLSLIMPEENLALHAASSQEKSEWLQALQTTIRRCLSKPHAQLGMYAARHASYTFRLGPLKDVKYIGRWLSGKMHGWGSLEWPDGQLYVGQFVNNMMHGYGRMNMPNGDHYEGQWREGLQNGRGIMKYECGDVYDGHFKDGLPYGHGIRKEGHFTANVASLYIGEWVAGVKQGYGVMDNISTGERYLGYWSNNVKHGCGIIVTLDGIYYEGVFMQDVLTGHGVMVYEDGAHYEGEFKSAGCFNGKGILTLNTGDYVEGSLQGMWNEGVKVVGTFFKNPEHSNTFFPLPNKISKPSSFGKLCVPPNQKWKSIFRQCLSTLAVPPPVMDAIAGGTRSNNENAGTVVDSQRLWANIAVSINKSLQEAAAAARANNSGRMKETLTDLDKIPEWGRVNLNRETYHKIHQYLVKAFESTHHPLGMLLAELSATYTATYGGVRVHPLLLSHAVAELHSLVARVYEVVRLLFPALPPHGQELLLTNATSGEKTEDEKDDDSQDEGEVVSASALLHPFVLPRVHAALFVLYALNNKAEDDAYWKRLLKWNKQPDLTLLAFLGIDQKFWSSYSNESANHGRKAPFSPMREQLFTEAVETLQQLKTTFSPLEKLLVIRNTFEQLTQAVKKCMGSEYLWTMDELFPVFHFVVVRSRILQLGSEINFIDDFMERHLQNGELGIMFTTLKACYYQILQEKISMSS